MRICKISELILAGSVLLIPGTALAADLAPPAPINYGQPGVVPCFYLRVDGGAGIHSFPDGTNVDIEDTAVMSSAMGCQVTESFRLETEAGYRMRASITDTALDAELESFFGFFNFYYDITNYGGWTPWLGAGIGASMNHITNVTAPAGTSGGDNLSFAWNLQAGVTYDLTPTMKVDAGYRYAEYGAGYGDDGDTQLVSNIEAHEFRMGFRWHFDPW